MHHTTVIAVLATLAAGSPANGQNSQPPPIPKEDWRLQSVMLDLLPNCKASPPATGHMVGAKPDPCLGVEGLFAALRTLQLRRYDPRLPQDAAHSERD
jgi:hypothetical protein